MWSIRQGSPESPQILTQTRVLTAWQSCGSVRLSSHTRGKRGRSMGDLVHLWYLHTRGQKASLHWASYLIILMQDYWFENCMFSDVQVSYPVCCPDKQSLCPRSICSVWDPLHVHLPNPRVAGWHCSSSQLKSQILKCEIHTFVSTTTDYHIAR